MRTSPLLEGAPVSGRADSNACSNGRFHDALAVYTSDQAR